MFQQRCATAKQEGWWGKIGDKLNREGDDGESDQEEARVSRNLFDLFEQADRAEKAVTPAAWGMDQGTVRADQGHPGEQERRTNPSPVRDELEQATKHNHTPEQSPDAQTKVSDAD